MVTTLTPREVARLNAGALTSVVSLAALAVVPFAVVCVSIALGVAERAPQASPADLAHLATTLAAAVLGHLLAEAASLAGLGVLALAFGCGHRLVVARVGAFPGLLARKSMLLSRRVSAEWLRRESIALRVQARPAPPGSVLDQLRVALVISPAAPPFAPFVQKVSIDRAEAPGP